jgi:hypothetical protein
MSWINKALGGDPYDALERAFTRIRRELSAVRDELGAGILETTLDAARRLTGELASHRAAWDTIGVDPRTDNLEAVKSRLEAPDSDELLRAADYRAWQMTHSPSLFYPGMGNWDPATGAPLTSRA